MKNCRKCNINLTLDKFQKDESYADGFMNICRQCNVENVRNLREQRRTGTYVEANRAEAARNGSKLVNKDQFKKRMQNVKNQAIIKTDISTGETKQYQSAKDAKNDGFAGSSISEAIKYNKIYKGCKWEKV